MNPDHLDGLADSLNALRGMEDLALAGTSNSNDDMHLVSITRFTAMLNVLLTQAEHHLANLRNS